MNNSKIEWCHDTANIWIGCQEVHAGCDNCYARIMDNRFSGGHWGPHTARRIVPSVWANLAKMQKQAAAAGEMRRVFVGSMMDIAEKPMPLVDMKGNEIAGQDTGYLRNLLFQQISAGIYPNLLFLFLSKRPGNYMKYIPEAWKIKPPTNIIYGASVSDQSTANVIVRQLLEVPGKHFLSIEPMIGPVDLTAIRQTVEPGFFGDCLQWYHRGKDHQDRGVQYPTVDWVIAGGESGHGARPMHPDWLRSLRDQCAAADVPFFFKQHGEWLPFYDRDKDDPDWRNIPKKASSVRCMNLAGEHSFHGERVVYFKKVGKKAAGRLLDGVEHNAFPIVG